VEPLTTASTLFHLILLLVPPPADTVQIIYRRCFWLFHLLMKRSLSLETVLVFLVLGTAIDAATSYSDSNKESKDSAGCIMQWPLIEHTLHKHCSLAALASPCSGLSLSDAENV